MIKVVFVLVVLLLSAIFAYLALSNKKDEETQETKEDTKSTKTQEREDEDTSLTATSQSIETEPPEKEDPGTCEITGSWAMVGTCNADGTAKYIQTYKESKPGACPSSVKADFKPCCYQKGDWKDITECKSNGKKTQKQTTINCAESFKTREVDCPYVGEWKKTGGCGSDGKQYYTRFTINSSATTTKTENCCYISPWSGWGTWGACNGSKRYRNRNRTVINCPSDTPTSDTGSQNCNHCAGYWEKNIKCWKSAGTFWGTPQYTKHTYDKYVRTKNASNGGDNSCPSTGTKGNWKTTGKGLRDGHEC